MEEKSKKLPRTISIFMLLMINVAAVGSVKNWPLTAEYGFSSLFYLLLAGVIFLIPVSFIAAESAFLPSGSCGLKMSFGTPPSSLSSQEPWPISLILNLLKILSIWSAW